MIGELIRSLHILLSIIFLSQNNIFVNFNLQLFITQLEFWTIQTYISTSKQILPNDEFGIF